MGSKRSHLVRNWLKGNRNLFLFVAMMTIVVMLPAFEDTRAGESLFAAVNTFIIVVAVAANGGSRRVFWVALCLSVPALVLRGVAYFGGHPIFLVWSWVFCAAVMIVTIIRLLGDMFHAGNAIRDRLFACATTYLVIGLLWCYLYAIAEELAPGSFSGLSQFKSLHVSDMAYFSFNIVTSIALTSVLPVGKVAQMLVILQEFVSVLYMAFVISRLVGLYAPEPSATGGPNDSGPESGADG